jgi:hypothetical protein
LKIAGSTESSAAWSVPPGVQLAAQQLLATVFDTCLKALANLGLMLQEVAETQQQQQQQHGGSSGGRQQPNQQQQASGGGSGGGSGGAGGGPSVTALHRLRQEQRGGSGSSGGGVGPAAAATLTGGRSADRAATAAGVSEGGALDPLVALQSIQSGLLPASSVTYANSVAANLGASLAGAASGGLAAAAAAHAHAPGGLGGLAPGAIQGLEWSRLASKTPGGLLKAQCAHLWQEMQAECLLLLGELLRASLSAQGSGSAAVGPAR